MKEGRGVHERDSFSYTHIHGRDGFAGILKIYFKTEM